MDTRGPFITTEFTSASFSAAEEAANAAACRVWKKGSNLKHTKQHKRNKVKLYRDI